MTRPLVRPARVCLWLLSLVAAHDAIAQEKARWQIGVNAIAGIPHGEFRNNIPDTRWGGSGYFTHRWRDTPLRLGGEIGLLGNGREDITLVERKNFLGNQNDGELVNSIYFARFIARLQPVYGRWSPYVEGIFGFSGFETSVDVKECSSCPYAIVESNTTYSLGGGGGIAFRLTKDDARQSGVSVEIGLRYLYGGETEYFLPSDLATFVDDAAPFPERSHTSLATGSVRLSV